jgi:hypothetical protein
MRKSTSASAWRSPDSSRRRFQAIEGSPKYLAIYDLGSPDVLQSAPYRHIVGAGKSVWTKRMESLFVNGRRNVYVGISERHR